jgi:hypothetical protein
MSTFLELLRTYNDNLQGSCDLDVVDWIESQIDQAAPMDTPDDAEVLRMACVVFRQAWKKDDPEGTRRRWEEIFPVTSGLISGDEAGFESELDSTRREGGKWEVIERRWEWNWPWKKRSS